MQTNPNHVDMVSIVKAEINKTMPNRMQEITEIFRNLLEFSVHLEKDHGMTKDEIIKGFRLYVEFAESCMRIARENKTPDEFLK